MDYELLNNRLTKLFDAVFFSKYASPVIWTLVAATLWPLAPLIFVTVCLCLALLPFLLVLTGKPASPIQHWSDHVVVITGGAHGIGYATASILAKKGARVIILDIHAPELLPDNMSFYRCDVSKPDAVNSISRRVIEDVGHPSILVNNAGIVYGKSILDSKHEEFDKTIAVNLNAHYYLIKAFLPGLLTKNSGHIVNIASVLGIAGVAMSSSYCASKFGVVGLSDALRQELHGTNVHSSCIYPGLISSGMFIGVSHRFPWLTPPLSVETVANTIVRVLQEGKSQDIKLPLYANLIGILRLLPVELADTVRRFVGANDDMKKYQHSVSRLKSDKMSQK